MADAEEVGAMDIEELGDELPPDPHPDTWVLEALNRKAQTPRYHRASGECVCKLCGKKYRKHSMDYNVLSAIDDTPFLHILCNGDRVKL